MRSVNSASSTMVRLLCCAVLLLAVCAVTGAVATSPQSPIVVFHASPVDLFNAEKSQWTLSLRGTATSAANASAVSTQLADAAEDATHATWTAMREVWVEGQPLENAAALLFALPPPTSSYFRVGAMTGADNEEGEHAYGAAELAAEEEKGGAAEPDSVLLRAQRRQLFGQPSLSFHGISCEEYGSAGGSASTPHGRCYFMRDGGEDFFFNYRVEPAAAAEKSGAAAGGAAGSHHGGSRRRRTTRAHDEVEKKPAAARVDDAPTPHTTTLTSEGDVWTEYIVLPGAETGVVGTEGDVHVGRLRVVEHLTRARDAANSARVQLSIRVALWDATTSTVTTIDARLSGVTGAYCEQAARHASMAHQARRTSFYNRYGFPVVYVGCLYGLLYGVAWLQARRKSSATAVAAAAPSATAPTAAPAVAKKQQ